MHYPRFVLALSMVLALPLVARPSYGAWAGPAGVPDLLDPAIRAQFIPLSVARLNGDPDFPALFLGNAGREFPQFLFVIVDARNGKETWSFQEDATIFFLLLAEAGTVRQVYLDEGFATLGKPSGKFIVGGPEAAGEFLARLHESYRRFHDPARFAPAVWQSP